MAYIKLGPTGDYFGSTRLGLYLSPGNAQYVEDSVLQNLLYNFLVTGFFVEIEEHEFNNIKVDRRALRGIPLQFVGVNQPTVIEPVRDILSTPPTQTNKGDRYIVWRNPTGEWAGKQSYIAEFNGSSWDYHMPKDNWIVPVYRLGISTKFVGTYPSGYWKLTPDTIDELGGSTETPSTGNGVYATEAYVLDRVEEEANARRTQDEYLIELINNIETHGVMPVASQVTIVDSGNYFQATNVELALQELAADLANTDQNLLQLNQLYQSLSQTVQQLINNGGSGGSTNLTAIVFLNTNSITYPHYKGRIPLWNLYEFDPNSGTGPVSPESILVGVLAQPYRVTYTEIRFSFPARYNLILIIG